LDIISSIAKEDKNDFYKSVIKSKYRMTYENVNTILEKNEESEEYRNLYDKYRKIDDMLKNMLELSKIIRSNKKRRGSIDFELPEIKVVLDENKNRIEISRDFDCVSNFKEHLALAVKDDKYGFVNIKGKEIIECKFDDANEFSEGFAGVKKDGKWGYINLKNEVVIPIEFTNRGVSSFKKGVAKYYTDSGIGLINLKGEIIAEPKYNSIEYIRENVAVVLFDDYYYLYDFVKEKKLKLEE